MAYIFHRVDGVWQEESKLFPTDEASYDDFGRDVDLYGYTDIIGSPFDSDMGNYSGSVYVFFRWDSEKWEELQKLTPTDGEADDEFGHSVAISGDTFVIGGIFIRLCYVYTNIDGNWIENGKILIGLGLVFPFW